MRYCSLNIRGYLQAIIDVDDLRVILIDYADQGPADLDWNSFPIAYPPVGEQMEGLGRCRLNRGSNRCVRSMVSSRA